jgi:hypothetical protein
MFQVKVLMTSEYQFKCNPSLTINLHDEHECHGFTRCAVDGVDPPVTKKVEYSLKSIIQHHPSSESSGHYTLKLQRDGQWFKINDSRVIKLVGDKRQATTFIGKPPNPCIVVYEAQTIWDVNEDGQQKGDKRSFSYPNSVDM